MAGSSNSTGGGNKCQLDAYMQQDIKEVLKQQQEGIQSLVALLKEDMEDLSIITEQLGSNPNQSESKKVKGFSRLLTRRTRFCIKEYWCHEKGNKRLILQFIPCIHSHRLIDISSLEWIRRRV